MGRFMVTVFLLVMGVSPAAQAFPVPFGFFTSSTDCPAGQMWDPDASACKTVYRYWRVRPYSAGSVPCEATKRAMTEVTFRWGGVWQTNAMTDYAVGTIGGMNVTITESDSYAPNSAWGWRAFGVGLWTSDGSMYSGSSPYNETSTRYVRVDFGAGNGVWISGYKIWAHICPVDGVRLEYSTNGTAWTAVPGSDVNNADFDPEQTYTW